MTDLRPLGVSTKVRGCLTISYPRPIPGIKKICYPSSEEQLIKCRCKVSCQKIELELLTKS